MQRLGWLGRWWQAGWARVRVLVVVALATGLAAALRFAMGPLFGMRIPFFTFYPAVMVCAAHGGLWSGALCTVLSAVLIMYFWLPPIGSFIVDDLGDGVALAIFVGSGFAICALHERLRRRQAELVAARAEAERAAKEAVAANGAKDEFLSVLSHELRTPLTAIVGWVDVLRTRSCEAAVLDRGLAAIERNAAAQTQIVADILDTSRIVAGQLRIDVQPIELAPVVAAALDVVRPAAGAKGVTLAATLDVAAGVVMGDPVRLQQVAWNLLVNAVKFTPRGGRVDVRLTGDASWLRLAVTDTGEGIPVDFLPHVFERFRQADTSSTRAHGGLGLGLAIVKHLVDLHGGTVAVESGGPRKGASFTVSLPLCEPARAPERSRDSKPSLGVTTLAGMHVLVVDDEPDARELIALILQDRGASVQVAASAAEGLRLLERNRVDVMVADIDMPGENGYELMRRAGALVAARGGRVPALALTACVGAHHVQEATRAGFRAHVAKPVTPDELVEAVAQLGAHGA